MQIKKEGLPPIGNLSGGTQPAKQAAGGESFQEMLLRRGLESAKAPLAGGSDAQSPQPIQLQELTAVAAVAGRSRVQYSTGGDVTDFLELVRREQLLYPGVDVGSLPPLPDSAGGQNIPSAQLEELRARYDTGSIAPPDQYELLRELTALRAISGEDVRKTAYTVSPGTSVLEYLTDAPEYADVAALPETDLKGRLASMIGNERFAVQHVVQRYGKRCDAVGALADAHQRVLDALVLI